MKLKIAYFGTPDFSAKFLEKILQDKDLPVEVKLVVTQPDKRVGRNQILTPSSVKIMAKKYGIDVFENCGLKIENYDLGLLYGYGEIIPAELLQTPKMGFWNIHPSLLPYYRGPSPTAYPLIFGDEITGITIFKMDEKIDHGPIIGQEKIKILKSEKRPELTNRLIDVGYELFKKIICKLLASRSGKIENWVLEEKDLIKQKDSKATYTRRLTKQDGFIPFSTLQKALNNEPLTFEELPMILKEVRTDSVEESAFGGGKTESVKENSSQIIFDYFRGLFPWPGIWTLINIKPKEQVAREEGLPTPRNEVSSGGKETRDRIWSKRLKLTDFEITDDKLILKKVQLEGKNEVDFETFNKAYNIF